MRLLLVEDDTRLADGIATDLRQAGFAVDTATDGIDAEYLGRVQEYDAIILDLGLPGKPGLDVLRSWRDSGLMTPVLILTARDSWTERVLGLKSGADDYLGKPFHFEELSARLDALLRRSTGRAAPELSVAGLRLDEERQHVRRADGVEVELTGTEFRLLRYLMSSPGQGAVQEPAHRARLRGRSRSRQQCPRGLCETAAREDRQRVHRDQAWSGLSVPEPVLISLERRFVARACGDPAGRFRRSFLGLGHRGQVAQ